MSRKSQTVATFAVVVVIPTGTNLKQAESSLKEAVAGHPFFGLRPQGLEPTVYLMRKVTEYGRS